MADDHGTPGLTNPRELLDQWWLQCRRANVAHLRATDSLTWRNYALSVLTAVLSTIVGSTVYATLQSDAAGGVKYVVASLSVVAAALATVQNILRYGTRAEKHRRASRDYGNAMRAIRDVQVCGGSSEDLCTAAERIRRRLDEVDLEAPNVPADIWVWAVNAVKAQDSDEVSDASASHRHHWPRSWWHARQLRKASRKQARE